MSALTSPKGPLPARVYWFRRSLVLAVVFLVVFTTARLLTGSSDAESGAGEGAVATVSSEVTSEPSTTPEADASGSPAADAEEPRKAKKGKKTPPPLPAPTGVCSNEEVVVTPEVPKERSSVKVPITLVLRSSATEACTWQVSPRSLTVKIDSGPRDQPDEIWHSRHCPAAIPTQDVTVYAEHDTEVQMVWSGRRSDSDCSNLTDWARAGWYHVSAAAYAGEPTAVQFELTRPSPVTVTRTVEPKPTKKPATKSTTKSPKPSGAVEPDLD